MSENKNVKRKNSYSIPPQDIKIEEGFNVREDFGSDNEDHPHSFANLVQSIKENGLRTPLKLRQEDNGDYYLVSGHRRMKAIEVLREQGHVIERVDFLLLPKRDNESERIADLIRDNDGKPLTRFEEARVYKALERRGLSNREIAKKVGRSESRVCNGLLMVSVEPKVAKIISTGKIPETEILKTLRATGDAKEQIEIFTEALKLSSEEGHERATGNSVDKARSEKLGTPRENRIKLLKELVTKGNEAYSKRKDFQIIRDVVSCFVMKELTPDEFYEKYSFDIGIIYASENED